MTRWMVYQRKQVVSLNKKYLWGVISLSLKITWLSTAQGTKKIVHYRNITKTRATKSVECRLTTWILRRKGTLV